MMFEGYKPTKREREAIDRAFYAVCELAGHDHRAEMFAKDEKRGYGNRNDSIPLAAAYGMCCKWFMHGVEKPDAMLRDHYFIRPAAIWFQGTGAYVANKGPINRDQLYMIQAGVDAHEDAFNRMMHRDKEALAKIA